MMLSIYSHCQPHNQLYQRAIFQMTAKIPVRLASAVFNANGRLASRFLACDTAIPQRSVQKHSPINVEPAKSNESVSRCHLCRDGAIPRTIVKKDGMDEGVEPVSLALSVDMSALRVENEAKEFRSLTF